MEFSRQEYWSGFSFPSPGNLPDPGIKPWSPALQADSLQSEPPGKPKINYIADKVLNGYLDQKWVYQFQKSSLFFIAIMKVFLFT